MIGQHTIRLNNRYTKRRALLHKSGRDSCRESSVVARGYEQTYTCPASWSPAFAVTAAAAGHAAFHHAQIVLPAAAACFAARGVQADNLRAWVRL